MEIQEIDKKFIIFDPQNPRSKLDEEEVAQLGKTIEEDGQKEPVHLEKLSETEYMVNEGHKRVASIQESKKVKTVKAIVEQKLTPEQRLLKQILIDTHRKNWETLDRDKAWKRLWDMGKYDPGTFSKKLSVSKDIVKAFLDRIELGAAFMEKIDNLSALNITETKVIKDKKLRKKVLKHASKEGYARKKIRKLSQLANTLDKPVLEEMFKGKISLEDADNMSGLDSERQKQALETTKSINTHKKKLKTALTDGTITTETLPFVEDTSKKVSEFQQMFFKLSSDLRVISYGLENLSKEDSKKYLNPQMQNILRSCLSELKTEVEPAIKTMEKVLDGLNKYQPTKQNQKVIEILED